MKKSKALPAVLMIAALAMATLIAACNGGEPEELTFNLEIRDRALTRENTTLEAKQGDRITIELTSDELVNYHLHGYDMEGNVGPEAPVTMKFDAYATGSFPFTIHIPSADGSGGHTHGGTGDECKAELAPDDPMPQISVSASLADEPHLVNVAVETQNFELSPDGNHWHLRVNGEPVGMYANPRVTFDTRLYESSGDYEITVSLNNAQHCDYGIKAMTTVTLDGGQSMTIQGTGNAGDTKGVEHTSGMEDMNMEQPEEVTIASLVVQPR